ncbi:hypothetical protein Ciccas_001723 [Cichlidogyrus casuarinus]|uniref:Uncharacterized protein n=1 Tax=Cichlidogyrus casuarinus TaxID=1844966 RepID=A0ABD2QJ74_9PLAT
MKQAIQNDVQRMKNPSLQTSWSMEGFSNMLETSIINEERPEFIEIWSPRNDLVKKSSITSQTSSGVFSETPKESTNSASGQVTGNESPNELEQPSPHELSDNTETIGPRRTKTRTEITNKENVDTKFSRIDNLFGCLEDKIDGIKSESIVIETNIKKAEQILTELSCNIMKKPMMETSVQTESQENLTANSQKPPMMTVRHLKNSTYGQLPPAQRRCRASLYMNTSDSESSANRLQKPRRPRSVLSTCQGTTITLLDAPSSRSNYYKACSTSDYSLSKSTVMYHPEHFSVNSPEPSRSSKSDLELKQLTMKTSSFDQVKLKLKRSMNDLFNIKPSEDKHSFRKK